MTESVAAMGDQRFRLVRLSSPFEPTFVTPADSYPCLIYAAASATTEHKATVANRLLESGCRYAVCAGAECEEWHDVIDEVAVELTDRRSLRDDELVLTTWHEDETIDDVAFFLVNVAGNEFKRPVDYLILVIDGSEALETEIRQALDRNARHAPNENEAA